MAKSKGIWKKELYSPRLIFGLIKSFDDKITRVNWGINNLFRIWYPRGVIFSWDNVAFWKKKISWNVQQHRIRFETIAMPVQLICNIAMSFFVHTTQTWMRCQNLDLNDIKWPDSCTNTYLDIRFSDIYFHLESSWRKSLIQPLGRKDAEIVRLTPQGFPKRESFFIL